MIEITEKEKYYIAGFLDRALTLCSKGGNQKVKKIHTGFRTDNKDLVLRFQSLFGGNINLSYKTSYSIKCAKIDSIKLFNQIGPYLKQKKDKVLQFVDFCKTTQNKLGAAPPEITFVDHENNPDYIAGLIDAGSTVGIYKNAKTQKENVWFQRFEIMDDEKYILNFLNSKNVKCSSYRKGLGVKRNYIGGSGNTVKEILETLLPLTKIHKDKFKIILDSFNEKSYNSEPPNLKNYRKKLIKAKSFVIDKSILSTNLNSEARKAEKQKKLKERAKNKLRKRLQDQKEHRLSLFKTKEKKQNKIVNDLESEFLRAKSRLEREKSKLKNIKSDFKVCSGTKKLMHKDNFNVDIGAYDGLCGASRDYTNYKARNFYRNSLKEYNEEKFLNPLVKISASIHTTMYQSLKTGKCSNSYHWSFLGYSLDHLKSHLEKQFIEGMSWENYGSRWQLDHIKPKSSFALQTEDELLECWSLENLQPLFEEHNLQKHAKVELLNEL